MRRLYRSKRAQFAAIAVTALLGARSVWASPCDLQIIHTNDLHSHFEHSDDQTRGGYAAVKSLILSLRAQAQLAGRETLVLDAGDFLEGSEYYLAKRGLNSFQMMNSMGYDAVTIGNHDWFMGIDALDKIMGLAPPTFPLLGANFFFGQNYKNVRAGMRQWAEFERCGVRVGVLGLTTDSKEFTWLIKDGGVADPVKTAKKVIAQMRKSVDFVIALTHVGVSKDQEIIQANSGIDLVVGGHDHAQLDHPLFVQDKDRKWVGIVQTGRYGDNVGDMIVHLEKDKPLEITNYGLFPVTQAINGDFGILQQVAQANADIEVEYGAQWWHEAIGNSEVELTSSFRNHTSEWGDVIADAMRFAANADIAFDLTTSDGITQPAGPITRKKIVASYPRMFETDHRLGWSVWKGGVPGPLVKMMVNQMISGGQDFNISGFELVYEGNGSDGSRKIKEILINGESPSNFKIYNLAVPEGLVRAASAASPFVKFVFWAGHSVGTPIWSAIEQRIKEIGTLRARLPGDLSRVRYESQ